VGKVGLPLFKAIAAELQNWNRWLEANSDRVDAFAKVLAGGLVGAFDAVRAIVGVVADVIGFLIEHAELGRAVLISLGSVIAAFAVNAAADWVIAFAPLLAVMAAVAGIVLIVEQLINLVQTLAGVIRDGSDVAVLALTGVAVALSGILGPIPAIVLGISAIVAHTEDIAAAWDYVEQKLIDFADTVRNLPVIKQIIDLGDSVYDFVSGNSGGATSPTTLPSRYSYSTSFGDTHVSVNAQSTDPAAIGTEVARAVTEYQQNMLKSTLDDTRGGRR
jgi:hypothetical protein